MSVFEKHYSKYNMFKTDGENEDLSVPMRIEAYFYASFHLIEAVAANHGLHIEKHQKVRAAVEGNPEVFGEEGEGIWRAFLEIERHIRPGQVYGGVVDGEKLERTSKLFRTVEDICGNLLEV